MQFSNSLSSRPQVKICGIGNPLEAQALDALGVEWIGFNFHPASARYIPPQAAAPMVKSLRRAKSVGVFVDLDIVKALDIIKQTGIQAVQLHGKEDWDYILKMPIPVIKALPHTQLADLGGLRENLSKARPGSHPLAYFLIDTQTSNPTFGGSGKTFDWNLLSQNPLPLPYFLAGGLGPENLAQALAACSPFAVDLNSKVEVAPREKDLDKVKACLRILSEVEPRPRL